MTVAVSTPRVIVLANPSVQAEDFDPPLSPRPEMPGTGFLSREHIIEATEACVAERGYDGTTIRAIAARLGCAVGSIYRYFTDKRQLLTAVAGRVFIPVLEELDQPGVTFEASLRTYLRQAAAEPERYRLLMWLAGAEGLTGATALPEVIETIIARWAALLGDRGRAEDAWARAHGLLMLGRDPRKIAAGILDDHPLHPAVDPQITETARNSVPYDAADDVTLL